MAGPAEQAMQEALRALGFGADVEMADTAGRFTEFLRDWHGDDAPADLSVCATSLPGQLVAVRDVPFHSLCAHHLLPFFGTVHIAYRAGGTLPGLGALPRVVRWAARRPQLQERLVTQVADVLEAAIQPQGLLVRAEARHLCVEMRGAESPATVVTEVVRGDASGLHALLGGGR